MGTKVELRQLIDLSVDIHQGKSAVNFVYLNKVLHELVNHLGIGNLEILIDHDTGIPPKESVVLTSPSAAETVPEQVISTTDVPTTDTVPAVSNMSMNSDKTVAELKEKVDDLEKKLSLMDGLDDMVDDQTKLEHKESLVGDMWNFVSLGKRVDGCESGIESHAKMIDDIRKQLKDLNQYKFYWDQLKDNSSNDLRTMIDGLVADMGEKTKEIMKLKKKIGELENSKPDEALAQELAKKVEGLLVLKDEIDSKMATLPTMADIQNIHESYVTWIGLDEIMRNYKPPRTPVPPSREGIEALQKAGELDQKTDDLGNKISGLQKEVLTKIDADTVDARISEAIKQKRPPSSRTEMARARFTETLQDLQDRLLKLEEEFGGKALPDDLKAQLDRLQQGMKDALAAAELISQINQENETNKSAISELNGQIEDLLDRYKILQDMVESAPKGNADIDSASLQALKDTIQALKDEQETHHEEINKLSEDCAQKDIHLKTLYSGVDDLREMKADKDFVVLEMEDKADKRSVDHKANRVFVDNHFDKLNSGLEAALRRCEGQEQALKSAINQISNDVEGKLDRMELQNVKDFLENRLKNLKGPAPSAPAPQQADADAAGMRRRLLKFHCISCDRPVEVNSGSMLPSTLPVAYGFPGMRSNRPYTTYELELIRQHQRNQNVRYPWSDPYDMPPTSRSCGGQHTMTYAHRRTRISALSQFFKDEEVVTGPVNVPLRETEIQGQDGHIYRGRLQQKFPVLPRVGQSDDERMAYARRSRERPRTAPKARYRPTQIGY